jgi:hypothetical protein
MQLRFKDVDRVASSKRLVLERRQLTDNGVIYRYSLYDNNQFVEDYFETLAQAWSYIYYYDEEQNENYRTDVESAEASVE